MLYVLAIFLPPVALALAGKYIQALFNFFLWITIIGAFFAMIWALLVIANHYADLRTGRIIAGIQQGHQQTIEALTAPHLRQPIPGRYAFLDDYARQEAEEREAEEAEARRQEALERQAEFFAAVRSSPRRFMSWLASSYRNLPEWAQPVLWGLLAASPVVAWAIWSHVAWRMSLPNHENPNAGMKPATQMPPAAPGGRN